MRNVVSKIHAGFQKRESVFAACEGPIDKLAFWPRLSTPALFTACRYAGHVNNLRPIVSRPVIGRYALPAAGMLLWRQPSEKEPATRSPALPTPLSNHLPLRRLPRLGGGLSRNQVRP